MPEIFTCTEQEIKLRWSFSDENDEDEKKELEQELARIRAEREAERIRKEQEEADAKNAQRNAEAAMGNHLLNLGQGTFNVKKRFLIALSNIVFTKTE